MTHVSNIAYIQAWLILAATILCRFREQSEDLLVGKDLEKEGCTRSCSYTVLLSFPIISLMFNLSSRPNMKLSFRKTQNVIS